MGVVLVLVVVAAVVVVVAAAVVVVVVVKDGQQGHSVKKGKPVLLSMAISGAERLYRSPVVGSVPREYSPASPVSSQHLLLCPNITPAG